MSPQPARKLPAVRLCHICHDHDAQVCMECWDNLIDHFEEQLDELDHKWRRTSISVFALFGMGVVAAAVSIVLNLQ